MAQRQIAARLNGDDYQARFFWYQAAQLLFHDSKVSKIIIEHDESCHIDDVAIYYLPPGRVEGSAYSCADFFQVKYHVDQRFSYCAENMIDPSFIGSTTNSLLQRFFETFIALRGKIPWFTLNLVSNWVWKAEDDLAKSIRDSGTLPDEFFNANEKSRLGKIREMWISHLGLGTDDETFTEFGRRLRLKLNFFCNSDFNYALSDRLVRAGLAPLDPSLLVSPYDDLARKFISAGTTTFDRSSFSAACQRENLYRNPAPHLNIRTIGIRSFVPFAENMANETENFVCVSDQFDGRHARSDRSWKNAATSIKQFLESQREEFNKDNRVLLDCHSSLAFLTGYLLTSRAPAYPAGPRPSQNTQKPSVDIHVSENAVWTEQLTPVNADASELAVVVSVTHQAAKDVLEFLNGQNYEVENLLEVVPATGLGPLSIRDADHAVVLASSLIKIIRSNQNKGRRTLLFLSVPNFLAFFIGQQARAIGELALFEYDFDGPEPRTYSPSITIPL